MGSKNRQMIVDVPGPYKPLFGPACQCLAEFYRQEFLKHHHCLEQHREYYSEVAIMQAEEALGRIIQRMEELSRRDDAGELVGQLLKQFDSVTKLSCLCEPETFH